MDNRNFVLKRSRLAIAFPILFFAVVTFAVFMAVPFLLCIFITFVQLILLYLFFRSKTIFSLHYLDKNEWTLSFNKSDKTERLHITKLINHRLYIVIYFEGKLSNPLVVWCDQLSLKQWKNLAILAKVF